MYILTEMPSLNINIAAGGGLALDILQIGAGGPSISFAVEQNIATFTGVSELYAHVGIMTLGAFYVAELGVYKKAYLGPMFFEAGLGIQGNDNENYGGRIFAGTGFQLAPRWALRARASAGMPTTGAHVEAVYTY